MPQHSEQISGWRRWFTHRYRTLIESWSGSFLVHVVVILLLAMITIAAPKRERTEHLIEMLDRPQELANERLDESEVAAEGLSFVPTAGVASATHGDPLIATATPVLNQQVAENLEGGPRVNLADVSFQSIPTEKLSDDLGMESPGDPSAAVTGYEGALDRVTRELILMLSKGKVLVVWLFDQSESIAVDREEIRNRVYRIYDELGLTGAAKNDDALLTSVASFGSKFTIHSRRPTSDVAKLREEMDGIQTDESGKELLFSSVIQAIDQHRKLAVQGKRQLALIVVTDERGDDTDTLEMAIAKAREASCRVYVMGRESPFGYPYIFRSWVDPETKLDFWLRTDAGPETAYVEQLQTDGLRVRYDAHSSGFGPYEQVRLCRETGGIFFMLPAFAGNTVAAEARAYEIEAMRPYLPDLASRQACEHDRADSPLRTKLYEIISFLNPWTFPEINLEERFSLNLDELAKSAAVEQQKSKALFALYKEAEKQLEALAPLREKEASPRWQANYDLLRAQVLCYQVRVYEYAAYLDAFVRSPRPVTKPTTTFWWIASRQKTITGEESQPTIQRAEQFFRDIQSRYPGTPFAARAAWELNRGFGVELVESDWDPRHLTIGATVKRPSL